MESILESIDNGWSSILKEEFEANYFKQLWSFVEEAYQNDICYPPKKEVFSAFEKCSLKNLKVIILGQDPYHGKGQAHGLAFSVNENIPFPPSLQNIFKELKNDLGIAIPKSGNLNHWAEQGVLLLNAVLTVKAGTPKSHQKKGWETFTNHIIQHISKECNHLVFLLWGGDAKKKAKLIDNKKHLILESGHPSPLSANRGHWFGNNHFSQVNDYLIMHSKPTIKW